MLTLTNAQVESQPLLLGNKLGIQIDRDPTKLAERLAQHYSLLDFAPRSGFESTFIHRSFSTPANDMVVTCGAVTPLHGRMGQREGACSVNLVLSGAASYRADGKDYHIAPKQPLFYSPPQEYIYQSNGYNGVVFDIRLAKLQATAEGMLGMPINHAILREFSQFKTLRIENNRTSQLLRRLCASLKMLEDPDHLLSLDIPHLRIDDLIYRHLVLLLLPAALLRQPTGLKATPQRDRIFEELLEWIREHLDAPLNLTELESRSGYSRRSLQNLFQLRFGCGPIQWIRRHRLEQARLALLSPAATDTVTTIAGRFGFNSLTVFSRDYTQLYGENPSETLRQGRQKIL